MTNFHAPLPTLDDVSLHAQRLLEDGYTRKGKWSLGENCNHLAIMMDFFSRFGILVSLARTFGLLHIVVFFVSLATRLGIRFPAFPFSRPKESDPVSDEEGVQKLVDAIIRQKCHTDPFQLWHCRHHLGFLELKSKD